VLFTVDPIDWVPERCGLKLKRGKFKRVMEMGWGIDLISHGKKHRLYIGITWFLYKLGVDCNLDIYIWEILHVPPGDG
jgi:hypothetical protein